MSDFKLLPSSHSLRVPATRRISLPASQRLSTITEGAQVQDQDQDQDQGRWSRLSALRASTSSAATHRTPPPPYGWVPESAVSGGTGANVNDSEEEKLARLRRTWSGATGRRGGWGRLLVLVVVILGILGLAIGLGVGLTVDRKKNNNEDDVSAGGDTTNITQPQDNSTPIQQFPLGQYSFLTTLRTQQTNCTSNPATWRCYPYTLFDSSNPSTTSSSQSTFNWIVRNTSAIYATNATTLPSNVPANLTISSTDDPFALSFTTQQLTYIYGDGEGSNSPSPRLTFSFILPKIVKPTVALTANNAATQCYFNNTMLSGTIYLTRPPADSLGNTTSTSSYEKWPYGVEIVQSSQGGQDTPECFEVVDGKLGDRVPGFQQAGEGEECRCEYRNFG